MSTVIVIFVVIIGAVAIIALEMSNLEKEKEKATLIETNFAPQLGLQYLKQLDFFELEKRGIGQLLKGRFNLSHSGLAQNMLSGSIKGLDVLFFTYNYRVSKNSRHQHPVLMIPTDPSNPLPLFVIRPPETWDDFKKAIGYEFITIPAAPSLMVQIGTENEGIPSILAHVPPQIWELIESNQWFVVHDGQWFMMYAYNRPLLLNLESYQYFIDSALEIFIGLLPDPTQLKKHA